MKLRLFWTLPLICLFAACTSQTVESNRLQTAGTYTNVASPGLVFPAGSSFSWSQGKSRVYDDPRFVEVDLDGMLRDSIKDALVSRGYHVSSRGGGYEVSYVAALEKSLSDADIDRHFGINPGLPSKEHSGSSYEKGTIIIDISDATDHRSLWRSAMQGYVAQNISKSKRKERLKRIVGQLFRTFPQAN